jgi:hypothetical protein
MSYGQYKVNEKVSLPAYKNGVTLQFFTIDFQANVSSKLAAAVTETANYTVTAVARSPVVVALEKIAEAAQIEIMGTLYNGNATTSALNIAVSSLGGIHGTATWDGTDSESFANYLQRLVQAEGTYQSVNLANATVVAMTF